MKFLLSRVVFAALILVLMGTSQVFAQNGSYANVETQTNAEIDALFEVEVLAHSPDLLAKELKDLEALINSISSQADYLDLDQHKALIKWNVLQSKVKAFEFNDDLRAEVKQMVRKIRRKRNVRRFDRDARRNYRRLVRYARTILRECSNRQGVDRGTCLTLQRPRIYEKVKRNVTRRNKKTKIALTNVAVDATGAAIASDIFQINVVGNVFPKLDPIQVGDTVVWTNKSFETIAINGDFGSSGILHFGQSYSHTFISPGTYSYSNTLKNGMEGEIQVVAEE